MALWRCEGCDTRYSVDAPRCPQCSGTDYTEDGAMPKIHADRPDTHEPVPAEPVAPAEPEPAAPAEQETVLDRLDPEPPPRKRPHTRANAGHAAGTGRAT